RLVAHRAKLGLQPVSGVLAGVAPGGPIGIALGETGHVLVCPLGLKVQRSPGERERFDLLQREPEQDGPCQSANERGAEEYRLGGYGGELEPAPHKAKSYTGEVIDFNDLCGFGTLTHLGSHGTPMRNQRGTERGCKASFHSSVWLSPQY